MRDHLREARNGKQSQLCDIIRSIWQSGGEVLLRKEHTDLCDRDAYILESRLIARLRGQLVNKYPGRECFMQTTSEREQILAYTRSLSLKAYGVTVARESLKEEE